MNIKPMQNIEVETLATPWQRAVGAMFQKSLQNKVYLFVYPYPARRIFHTFFCPPLRIVAWDMHNNVVFDRLVPPNRFVRIPESWLIAEADIDTVFPSLHILIDIAKQQYSRRPRDASSAKWGQNMSLGRLFFSLMALAVTDIRRINEINHRRSKLDPAVIRRFNAWERGQLVSSAGFIVSNQDVYSLPYKVVSLAMQLLRIERDNIDELMAAEIAGIPWKNNFPNRCLRCGRNGSWRQVISVPEGRDDTDVAIWRYDRPENAVPLCYRCAKRLNWNRDPAVRHDLGWGLWGPRFEAFLRWHNAFAQGALPVDWDKDAYPLWPSDYGGPTWGTGSGAADCADPRPPQGVQRSQAHKEAIARALSPKRKRVYLRTSPLETLVHLGYVSDNSSQDADTYSLL